jgi:hypothetical protein
MFPDIPAYEQVLQRFSSRTQTRTHADHVVSKKSPVKFLLNTQSGILTGGRFTVTPCPIPRQDSHRAGSIGTWKLNCFHYRPCRNRGRPSGDLSPGSIRLPEPVWKSQRRISINGTIQPAGYQRRQEKSEPGSGSGVPALVRLPKQNRARYAKCSKGNNEV